MYLISLKKPVRAALAAVIMLLAGLAAFAQNELTASLPNEKAASTPDYTPVIKKSQQVVRITGVRFAYPLVQRWIDEFNKEFPDIQLVIEARGSTDPSQYELLIEAYEHDAEFRKNREYASVARYAILPVANSKSGIANEFSEKGLDKDLLVQLFFHDPYSDKQNQREIKSPFTIYTRLQKAGAPITFSRYFGFEQKDVKGKSIAGADEHILKSVLRDSTALSYLPLSLIYDHATQRPVNGISVLPVDLNGNGKVNDEEKFYQDLAAVLERFEKTGPKDLNNVPIEYLHFSVDKGNAKPEAVAFVRWVIANGQRYLHEYGYLNPEPERLAKDKSDLFASKGK
ncbi:MAG TPA: hypothetical protein VFZ52_03635 [Chryseolinea sp.]